MTSHRLWFWSVIAGIGVAGNFSFYFLSIAEGMGLILATVTALGLQGREPNEI